MKDTRQRMIETAARLMERQGYHGTGLNQILEEASAPRGSLYYHFPGGKEELAAEAIRSKGCEMSQHAAAALAREADPITAIGQFTRTLAEHVVNSDACGGAPLALTTLEAPTTGEQLRHACQMAYRDLRAPFAAKLRPHVASPERADRLATLIVAALDGAVILCRAEQSSAPMLQVAEEIEALLRCVLAPDASERISD